VGGGGGGGGGGGVWASESSCVRGEKGAPMGSRGAARPGRSCTAVPSSPVDGGERHRGRTSAGEARAGSRSHQGRASSVQVCLFSRRISNCSDCNSGHPIRQVERLCPSGSAIVSPASAHSVHIISCYQRITCKHHPPQISTDRPFQRSGSGEAASAHHLKRQKWSNKWTAPFAPPRACRVADQVLVGCNRGWGTEEVWRGGAGRFSDVRSGA
jgi:hypothetical protein